MLKTYERRVQFLDQTVNVKMSHVLRHYEAAILFVNAQIQYAWIFCVFCLCLRPNGSIFNDALIWSISIWKRTTHDYKHSLSCFCHPPYKKRGVIFFLYKCLFACLCFCCFCMKTDISGMVLQIIIIFFK